MGRFTELLTDGRLADSTKQVLKDYFAANGRNADAKLRGLVHLILSTPVAHLN